MRIYLALVMGALLSGLIACSSQPIAQLAEPVEVSESDIGHGRPVYLEVVDLRDEIDQRVLYERGIVPDDFDLALQYKKALRVALFSYGFSTAHEPSDDTIKMTAYIDSLDMAWTDQFVMSEVDLSNQIRLEVVMGRRIETFQYLTQQRHKLVLQPGRNKNKALLGGLVQQTLRRALNDPKFIGVISQS